MVTKNDGGPAFPTDHSNNCEYTTIIGGMSLRDYFAAKALPVAFKFYDDGYCGNDEKDEHASATVALVAYELADAMLKAREAY